MPSPAEEVYRLCRLGYSVSQTLWDVIAEERREWRKELKERPEAEVIDQKLDWWL